MINASHNCFFHHPPSSVLLYRIFSIQSHSSIVNTIVQCIAPLICFVRSMYTHFEKPDVHSGLQKG